jgi:hypothetical protein
VHLVILAVLCQGATCVRQLPAGETQHKGPEWAWKRHACDKKRLPFLAVERNVVYQRRIEAGNQLRHVLIYSLCPETAGVPVRVKLIRRVLLGGTVIHADVADGQELKPGRWIITAFIEVPPGAAAGNYELEVAIEGPKVRFAQRIPFAVEAARSAARRDARGTRAAASDATIAGHS